jgi:hypothetical protein
VNADSIGFGASEGSFLFEFSPLQKSSRLREKFVPIAKIHA